jgi:DNA polymerase III subunit alpha
MLLTRSFSHYSLLSAVAKIPALISGCVSKGYSTLCLTDDETGAGFVEFYEACKKEQKSNPSFKGTVGVTLKIPNFSANATVFGKSQGYSKVAFIAKNNQGYKDICKLISIARVERENPYHVLPSDIEKFAQNDSFYLVLCGNDHEIVASLRQNNSKQAHSILASYCKLVGSKNLLVEAAFTLYSDANEEDGLAKIKSINLELEKLCEQEKVKLVISPAPRYIEKEQVEVFKVLLAIRDAKKIWDISLTRDFHLPTLEELKKEFSYLDSKVFDTTAIEESIDLFIRTDYDKHASEAFFPFVKLEEGENYADRLKYETYIGFLTRFNVPDGFDLFEPEAIREYWYAKFPYVRFDNLKVFVSSAIPDTSKLAGYAKDYWQKEEKVENYVKRMDSELEIIVTKGYPSYFLVFADLMRFCRQEKIVTTTRGSAAGSLVGYLTGVNTIDPMMYKIPFERFLNPLRPSAPDIDGDFADNGREKVITYLTQKYGKPNVTQIITFGTLKPKAAVRDVGRAIGISYTKCDKLSKLIPVPPQGKKATFAWCLETSTEFNEAYLHDEDTKRIVDLGKQIESNYRHASVHAAGVVITPTEASDYAPLQWDSDHKFVICQYDMRIGEKVGHVKLDILGIRNLAILGDAIVLTEKRRDIQINLQNIDLKAQKVYELLAKGRTMGLFQISGPAMTRYLVDMEPNKVQDLMAMVALYRPGPMANIPDYIKRKKNPKLITYITPEMKNWMEDSYGILVYQDDLLYSVLNLAGYDWAQADTFRKGVGKKIPEVMESQHILFVDGCVKNGLAVEKAEEIWDLFVPFAAYGFNKAHASSYGMVSYWTCYMKAEYTVEFMTALMTSESANLDKISEAINECKELGITVLPPNVNTSFADYTIESDITIRYGLNSVKMLGSDVVNQLIENRNNKGRFKNFDDFLERMSEYKGFNKRSLEALIWSGALDDLGAGVIQTN